MSWLSCCTSFWLSSICLARRGAVSGASRRSLPKAHAKRRQNLPSAIVKFAGDVPPLFVLSLQQPAGQISKLFRLLYNLARAGAYFSVQRLRQVPIFSFCPFKVSDVHPRGVQEKDVSLVVDDGMHCEIDHALGIIGPMVGQNFAVGSALCRLQGCGVDFGLHFFETVATKASPRRDAQGPLLRDNHMPAGIADSRR